jgi:ABC-type multidrug transport system ATPase subunit
MIHDCLFGGYGDAAPPMQPEAALRRDWSLSFHCLTYATRRGRLIIDDATGFIPQGSCCAVVGPSSVDKRILLKLLSCRARGGLLGGRVAYGGRDACEQCAAYVDGAMVDDEMRSSLTALSRVEASSAVRFGVVKPCPLLRALGLDGLAIPSHRAEAVVVAIAKACVHAPPILCIEDPFRSLDMPSRKFVATAIKQLSRKRVVIVSIDAVLDDASFSIFDHVLLMRQGSILYGGAPQALDALERQCMNHEKCKERYERTVEYKAMELEVSQTRCHDRAANAFHVPDVALYKRIFYMVRRDFDLTSYIRKHSTLKAIAVLWASMFWDCDAQGAQGLEAWDATSSAFCGGQLVLWATLHDAPALVRRHGAFQRSRECSWFTFLVVRTLLLVVDALARGTAPLIVSGAAGYPRGVNNLWIVYVLGVLLALSAACLVEALASYQYDDGDAVRLQSSIRTDRISSARVSGQFGALCLVFSLCAGFGLDLAHMSPYHPLAWVARVNPLRWFVEGVVLRSSRRPRFKRHRAPSPARGGFSRSSSEMCVRSLVVLILCFRLISYCFLARAPEDPISVDPRKLRMRCFLPEEEEDEEDAEGIVTIPPSTIHVRDLTITDDDFAPVVSGASFQIKSGECVSIVGDDVEATRALLRALAQRAGTTKRVAGAVTIQDVSGGGARVAWVPSSTDHLDASGMLDARTLVAYAAKLSGHDESHVEACLHLCGVTSRDRPVNYSECGEPVSLRRRRISLACAAATKAPVLFIDDACGLTSHGRDALSSLSGEEITKCCANLAKKGFCVVAAAPGINADQGLHFSRCVVLCRRTEGGCDIAYDAPPKALLGEAFPCSTMKRKPAREAAWGDLEDDDLLPPSRGSFSSLVKRDWACVMQDRERVGALYASPVFHAVWLGVAFANQGRQDPRATLYLCYGLLAAFTYPVPGSCAEEVAFLKRVRHEGYVWSAVVSRMLVRSVLVLASAIISVAVAFAASRLSLRPRPFSTAVLGCVGASILSRCIITAAACATRHADDVGAFVAASLLAWAGLFRFPRDFCGGWRGVSDADPLRWLLEAVAAPQLRGVEAPRRSDYAGNARAFVGYNATADGALLRFLVMVAPVAVVTLICFSRAVVRESSSGD